MCHLTGVSEGQETRSSLADFFWLHTVCGVAAKVSWGCRHLKVVSTGGFTSRRTCSHSCWLEALVSHWIAAGGLGFSPTWPLFRTCQWTSPRVSNPTGREEWQRLAWPSLWSPAPPPAVLYSLPAHHWVSSDSREAELGFTPLEEYYTYVENVQNHHNFICVSCA